MEWLGGGGWRKNCNKLPTAPLQDKHPGPETEARVTIIEGRKRLSILPQHWDGIVHLSRVSRKAKVQLGIIWARKTSLARYWVALVVIISLKGDILTGSGTRFLDGGLLLKIFGNLVLNIQHPPPPSCSSFLQDSDKSFIYLGTRVNLTGRKIWK